MQFVQNRYGLIATGEHGREYQLRETDSGVYVDNTSLNMTYGAPSESFRDIASAVVWCRTIESASISADELKESTGKIKQVIAEMNAELDEAAGGGVLKVAGDCRELYPELREI